MLSKKDIQMFEKMFSTVVTRDTLRDILRENNEVFGSQLKREMRDEMHAIVKASANGVIAELRTEIHTLRDDILDLVNDEIFSQIDECQRDIVQLKLAVKIA